MSPEANLDPQIGTGIERKAVRADALLGQKRKTLDPVKLPPPQFADTSHAVIADHQRRLEPGEPVDEVCAEEAGRQIGTTFDQQAGQPLLAQRLLAAAARSTRPDFAVGSWMSVHAGIAVGGESSPGA